tara:strand:- start:535 stop:801 length:267 start_codon:yes stop_codon:yes gene_type:complete
MVKNREVLNNIKLLNIEGVKVKTRQPTKTVNVNIFLSQYRLLKTEEFSDFSLSGAVRKLLAKEIKNRLGKKGRSTVDEIFAQKKGNEG